MSRHWRLRNAAATAVVAAACLVAFALATALFAGALMLIERVVHS